MKRILNVKRGNHASFKSKPEDHRKEMERAIRKERDTKKNRHVTKTFKNALAKRRKAKKIAKASQRRNRR